MKDPMPATMTNTMHHAYVQVESACTIERDGRHAIVRFQRSGVLDIRHPGLLRIESFAYFKVTYVGADIDLDDGVAGIKQTSTKLHRLPLQFKVFTPDGQPFLAERVSMADLGRFRNLHGVTQGDWTYEVTAESEPVYVHDQESDPTLDDLTFKSTVSDTHVRFSIGLDETIPSQSAAPLINQRPIQHGVPTTFTFDLFRLGNLHVDLSSSGWIRRVSAFIELKDPNGQVVATINGRQMQVEITPSMLLKSRNADGSPRLWTLHILDSSVGFGGETTLTATVMAQTRISTNNLLERLNYVFGAHGNKLSIYGEMIHRTVDGASVLFAVARLKILDIYTAETFEMQDLLDDLVKSHIQDDGVVDPQRRLEIKAQIPYVVGSKAARLAPYRLPVIDLDVTPTLDVSGVEIKSVSLSLSASTRITPSVPALKFQLTMVGAFVIRILGVAVASVTVRGGAFELEAGFGSDGTGQLKALTSMPEHLLDIDVSVPALLSLGPTLGGIAAALTEYIEHEVNEALVRGFQQGFELLMGSVPRTVAILLGGFYDVRPPRMEGGDLVIDYVAPLEPEPKPLPLFRGAIGRSMFSNGPAIHFLPPTIPNTWKVENLQKIEHVVMVMMENRSFDHVLGYRAQAPGAEPIDGLSSGLLEALATFKIGRLRDSPNMPHNALGFATQFPQSVGHRTADVIQQLEKKLTLPDGQIINSPEGFLANFQTGSGLNPEAVLGYHDGQDLPFYKFLADHYGYCDRYFCSHPGPTLPNRMYSLAGDLQFDRVGEAIVDNNKGESIYFSRALSIFDLLSRHSVSWRVYESNPSLATLRLFARYAGDTTHIVPIARLKQDVSEGNLPSFTVIEPAMHHGPQNDDHPVADMYNGQLFLKDVYDTLSANKDLWLKTLLIITYDEHGGFYDHVVPPMADVRLAPDAQQSGRTADGQGEPAGAPPSNSVHSTLATPYGLRVPAFVVSPWVPAGPGPSMVLDHCSILKTVIARFCGRNVFLSDRVAASQSFEPYLTASTPRVDSIPKSPDLRPLLRTGLPHIDEGIITRPITRAAMQEGSADYHDITGMMARMIGRQ